MRNCRMLLHSQELTYRQPFRYVFLERKRRESATDRLDSHQTISQLFPSIWNSASPGLP